MASLHSASLVTDIASLEERLISCKNEGVSEAVEIVFGNLMKDITEKVDEEISGFLNWYWNDHKL